MEEREGWVVWKDDDMEERDGRVFMAVLRVAARDRSAIVEALKEERENVMRDYWWWRWLYLLIWGRK